ncbi:hypothetical protein [Devosia sp. 2618]|uniref:hypothetical protein n=1 Tax=Devosia sp. 2618 TaxID=3156454 RepID=UPI0033928AD2
MSVHSDPLFSVLDGSRSRLLTRAALLVAVTGLAAGALVWLGIGALEGARRLGWTALSAPLPVLQAALAAIILGALAAAIYCVWNRALLRPGSLALAIDRRGGMDLAYATALEVAAAPTQGPVAQSLLSSARERSANLDLRRLWPLGVKPLRNMLIAGLIAAAAALGITLAQPPLLETSASLEASTDAESIRTDAQDLADRLNREAVLRQDPMLAAIARAIEERVADAAPEVSAEDLENELSALADQARDAFGENAPSWLNQRGKASQLPDGATATAGGSGPRNPDVQQGIDVFAINLEDIESARRNQEIATLEADGRSADEETEALGKIVPGDNKPAGSGMTPEKIEPQQLQAAGRESVGAAAESGKGPADQAGAGTSALEGDSMVDGVGGDDPMALPQSAQETGRRIRVTLPPSEAEQAANGAGGAAGAGAGSTTNGTVERPSLPAGSRPSLARYFERVGE